ncbi:hypothetical protein PRUPE_4G287300 [Prunus persica]|uniref:No apical meristem-associated C-terminal domain-containing protein n=1 Tax=Prunus persica TaxID=3760 RepID=M5WLY4_PRUPE|nr:hypothetical protein PRUPE_4G287300 [Prunus persica]
MAESSKQKGANYSIDEDVALCRAWIIISEDPIIRNCQSIIQFHLDAQEVRSSKSLKSLWINISQMCNKFSECLTQVERLNKSGQNENDNRTKKVFLIDHCWNVVQHAHKWQPFEGFQSSPFMMIHRMNPFQKLKHPHKPQTHGEGLWDTKKAKELKRKAIVEESSQDDKEMKEIMRSYKDCMIENKELKVMFKETATIQTPAIRRWVQQKQADIIAKSSSRSLTLRMKSIVPNPQKMMISRIV